VTKAGVPIYPGIGFISQRPSFNDGEDVRPPNRTNRNIFWIKGLFLARLMPSDQTKLFVTLNTIKASLDASGCKIFPYKTGCSLLQFSLNCSREIRQNILRESLWFVRSHKEYRYSSLGRLFPCHVNDKPLPARVDQLCLSSDDPMKHLK
jgi:hypothetical protein